MGHILQKYFASLAPARPRNPARKPVLNDEQVLKGRNKPVKYSTADIDGESRVIRIWVRMDYRTPAFASRASGLASKLTDAQFEKYARLSDEGIAKYWSRAITLNGNEWTVKVCAQRSAEGMPMTLANPGCSLLGHLSSRSRNPHPILCGNLYYDAGCGGDPDAIFRMTAAHEIGHGFLTNACGIAWSWGHKGTSSLLGRLFPIAPQYPVAGEIGLMSYYNMNSAAPAYRGDVIQRTIASEDDVKALIYISRRDRLGR